MLSRLDGMFAFVLYDENAGTLLLARDRLGQKPLWYAPIEGAIVFASEAKALLAHPLVGTTTSAAAITHYITMGYVPSPASAWTGIQKLSPGHMLQVGDGSASPAPYWQPSSRTIENALPAETIQLVRDGLAGAVSARMVSDVPLGALLSGGIDSSIIVALMCQAVGRTGGVRTFTAGFDEDEFDERPAARELAKHLGTDHTELLIRPDTEGMVDRIVDMYDEPFADSSALATWLICREARRHVTVALSGDGGDEVFAGYDRYRAMHLSERMSPLRHLCVRVSAAMVRPFYPRDERSRLRRFVRFAEILTKPPSIQYFTLRRLFAAEDLKDLFTDDFIAGADIYGPQDWFCNLYEDADFGDEVSYAQRHDLMSYLPDDLLVKTDIASMACSLEMRSPMLDHGVVETASTLPLALRLNAKQGKIALRKAFGDILPAGVFDRPKRGFALPLGRWLREDLRETMKETLLDEGFLGRGIFRREAIYGLINDHLSRRDDHRHRLWALMILARWLAKHA